MKAEDIARKAADIVGGNRKILHGDKFANHNKIVGVWNAIISHKLKEPLNALDAANMMEGLKIARRYAGSHNIDDYIDGAGYAACAGEIAEQLLSEKLIANSQTHPKPSDAPSTLTFQTRDLSSDTSVQLPSDHQE